MNEDKWGYLMGSKMWDILWKNVNMSSEGGAAGMREENNPKLSGRIRKGNQSTSRHEITITKRDLKMRWIEQDGICYWYRVEMSLDDLVKTRSPFAPSVDRIDSSRGYHLDNIVLTTRMANLGRGAYDDPDFSERVDRLFENRRKEKIHISNLTIEPEVTYNIEELFE